MPVAGLPHAEDDIFGFLPTEGTTHNALNKWEREDIAEAVDQGHIWMN
jgi:nucleolar pre-ribosomal-associated protein 1